MFELSVFLDFYESETVFLDLTVVRTTSSLLGLMKRHRIHPDSDRAENTSIGKGMSISATIGESMQKNLPKILQIPKAVPDRTTGKINGVEI